MRKLQKPEKSPPSDQARHRSAAGPLSGMMRRGLWSPSPRVSLSFLAMSVHLAIVRLKSAWRRTWSHIYDVGGTDWIA